MVESWATVYDTRCDQFRVREALLPAQWCAISDVSRSALFRLRSGRGSTRIDILARLVRGAAYLLARDVRASEIVDVGEDSPPSVVRRVRPPLPTLRYGTATPLALYLPTHGLTVQALARKAGVVRSTVRKIAEGIHQNPDVQTVALLVTAIRELTGEPVRAQQFWDVGEDPLAILNSLAQALRDSNSAEVRAVAPSVVALGQLKSVHRIENSLRALENELLQRLALNDRPFEADGSRSLLRSTFGFPPLTLHGVTTSAV